MKPRTLEHRIYYLCVALRHFMVGIHHRNELVQNFDAFIGRLSDILGRRGAMLLALTLFGNCWVTNALELSSPRFSGSGTILCGLAPSMNALIAARAIAGMGGGGFVISRCFTSSHL